MKYEIQLIDMKRVIGSKLIDAEVRTGAGDSASGADEVVLTFDNGGEILIYISDDNVLWVEGD